MPLQEPIAAPKSIRRIYGTGSRFAAMDPVVILFVLGAIGVGALLLLLWLRRG